MLMNNINNSEHHMLLQEGESVASYAFLSSAVMARNNIASVGCGVPPSGRLQCLKFHSGVDLTFTFYNQIIFIVTKIS